MPAPRTIASVRAMTRSLPLISDGFYMETVTPARYDQYCAGVVLANLQCAESGTGVARPPRHARPGSLAFSRPRSPPACRLRQAVPRRVGVCAAVIYLSTHRLGRLWSLSEGTRPRDYRRTMGNGRDTVFVRHRLLAVGSPTNHARTLHHHDPASCDLADHLCGGFRGLDGP